MSRSPSPEEARRAIEEAARPPASDAPSRRLVLTPASEITPRPVRWGWQDRLPAGHVSMVAGREGIGKSLLLTWQTASITRGTLPGIYADAPRPVFYCATEDSWQHTIVPRLIAAGADLALVYRVEVEAIEATAGTSFRVELSMPRDCDLLAAEVKRLEVGMVALDPLMSAIDRTVDTNNDREMRTVLEPLARLADDTGCMIVGLGHFNKSGDADPLNLVMAPGRSPPSSARYSSPRATRTPKMAAACSRKRRTTSAASTCPASPTPSSPPRWRRPKVTPTLAGSISPGNPRKASPIFSRTRAPQANGPSARNAPSGLSRHSERGHGSAARSRVRRRTSADSAAGPSRALGSTCACMPSNSRPGPKATTSGGCRCPMTVATSDRPGWHPACSVALCYPV